MTSGGAQEILDVGIAVSGASSEEEILRIVLQAIVRLMPHDQALVGWINPQANAMNVRRIPLDPQADMTPPSQGQQVPIDENGALGWVVQHKKPHLRRSAQEPVPLELDFATGEAKSHVVVPLPGRVQILGVLAITSSHDNAFDEQQVILLCKYARLAGLAIDNLHSFETTRDLAIKDGLTGVYNHRHFQDVLGGEINRLNRYGSVFSLLMLDIDHFKLFNDRFGHQAGDRILNQTAGIIRKNLRISDQVFRYGGEEFAILLPSTDSDDSVTVARKLLSAQRTENEYRPSRSVTQRLTVSIGLATAPRDAGSREGLIACAEQALCHAKTSGRNKVVAFSWISELQSAREKLAVAKTPEALAVLCEAGRPTLHQHSQRVVEIVETLADALHLPTDKRINLKLAASCHDLGELGLPRELLDKPGPLNERERLVMQTHAVVGETLLHGAVRVQDVLDAVLHHHERFDGKGYPKGISGSDIPFFARILSIAETFDALVTNRPYRKETLSFGDAYGVLREAAGSQFDPGLVEMFILGHSKKKPRRILSDDSSNSDFPGRSQPKGS